MGGSVLGGIWNAGAGIPPQTGVLPSLYESTSAPALPHALLCGMHGEGCDTCSGDMDGVERP